MANLPDTSALALKTRADVDRLINELTDLWLNENVDVADEKASLLVLQEQLRTGDYIVLEPDLSGWRYVSTHYDPATGRERNLGHDRAVSVAALALRLGQPVVIGGEVESWRETVARRLRMAGVVAITDMEG